jgi:hypothetical protein
MTTPNILATTADGAATSASSTPSATTCSCASVVKVRPLGAAVAPYDRSHAG